MTYGLRSKQAQGISGTFAGNTALDPKAGSISATVGQLVSYYRPSGSQGFYFFNGIVERVLQVTFPSGRKRQIISVN